MQKQFNPAQKKAISHYKGPLLVLAGPGSGKTTVIVERVHTLLTHHKVPPERILVATFSKAAALEMKERFLSTHPDSTVVFGTLHSLFYRILKNHYGYSAKNILKEGQKEELVRKLFLLLCASNEAADPALIKAVCDEISKIKGMALPISEYQSTSLPSDFFHLVFKAYQEVCLKRHLIDFDDMVLQCFALLNKDSSVLRKWQNAFSFILVDEFQDLSLLQYRTLCLLASPENNLFVVGDDDQSIYGFRGAVPNIMRIFLKDFKHSRQLLLNINYRCHKKILYKALALISLNRERFDKNLRAGAGKYHGCQVLSDDSIKRPYFKNHRIPIFQIQRFSNADTENEAIVQRILSMHRSGFPFSSFAVLYRNHNDAFAFMKRLEEKQIPLSPSGVSVMTMHASKGLEFDVVFLPSVNKGVIPHKKAVGRAGLEEERRLFYVAMTRAKKHLFISYCERRYNKKAKPSAFLIPLRF